MKPTSDTCVETVQPDSPPANAFTTAEEIHLREVLKRCPAPTYQAACQFRKTGDPRYLPDIIHGIIERFVESDLRPKLRQPPDSLCLVEDLGLDSLTMMEIVLLVEDVLAISIRNEELRPLRTLGDIRHFIAGKLHGQSGLNDRQAK